MVDNRQINQLSYYFDWMLEAIIYDVFHRRPTKVFLKDLLKEKFS